MRADPDATDVSSAPVYGCSRRGWTKRSFVTRMHPDDLQRGADGLLLPDDRAWTAEEMASFISDGLHMDTSIGEIVWIADASIAIGCAETVEVLA